MNKKELKQQLKALGIVVENDRIKKSDIEKALGLMDGVRYLLQVIHDSFGSRKYSRDIENLFRNKFSDISYRDNEALMGLTRDLLTLSHQTRQLKRD